MKRFLASFLTVTFLLPAFVANAQVAPSQPSPSTLRDLAAAVAATKKAPAEKLPTSSLDVFPKLPPSSLCAKEKLLGTWKLLMVYEVPSGREMKTYMNSPLQYYVFTPDNRYGEYVGPLQALTLQEVKTLAIDMKSENRQFVVNDKGMLFFYTNRLAVDSLACFIVEGAIAPFRTGQLLLMPPEKSARGGRMLKVYQRVAVESEPLPKPYTGMVNR